MLQRLYELLTPNGGASLADKINEIHRWQREDRAQLLEHAERLTTIERALLAVKGEKTA